ncbi:MAG TPA: UDP-N-acetylmuramoyl-L-alanyl-D-glutamate--2,6-diaminopimelate ligase [Alphaproteobacteria bacterium]|nr:UDP-N-acetylmuramoyl-L-alanyl-D-glutamate--2,6-diaminopimelate ligase [Alphaproteobacteria bacterium]
MPATPRVLQDPPPAFAGLTADSRAVRPGWLFAALRGANADGRAFIGQALDAGAAAILTDELPDKIQDQVRARAQLILSSNPRRALAELAARQFGPQPRCIAMVTGTNGKTSTVEFARQLWTMLDEEAASIGTLGLTRTKERGEGALTTPDPIALARMLAKLAADGVECVALEASSHGLDQERLSGVRASVGVFTSFSRDHLDYHATPDAYMQAKLRLFRERLSPGHTAIVCADMAVSVEAQAAARQRGLDLWTYGRNGDRLAIVEQEQIPGGQRLALRIDGSTYSVRLPLVGDFQALNALAALGITLAFGAEKNRAVEAMERLEGVDGRLQLAGRTAEGAAVYVDYAHTPAALESALRALRPAAAGRLLVVFGAGGDRDRGKRAEMGAVAARLADMAVITDDNPRSEDAASIRRAILAACPAAKEIGDRAEAIAWAINDLQAGDVLLIAGKGHETGQTIGGETVPFDDRGQARAALKARS